jgi:alpha-tubulin suppressor-like RCC1 family protein
VAVSAGGYYSLAQKSDGSIWAWGLNHKGQFGNGTDQNSLAPILITQATDWSNFGAGNSHTVGLKSGATLWTCGDNEYGQLGDSTNINRNEPVQVKCPAVTEVKDEISENSLVSIYPNPAQNFLFVEGLANVQVLSIQILDLSGKGLLSFQFQDASQIKIDVHTLPAGMYLVHVWNGKNHQTFKVIKD